MGAVRPMNGTRLGAGLAIVLALVRPVAAEPAQIAARHAKEAARMGRLAQLAPPMTMAYYLDRLMMAESGGDDEARNPMSSALGPYQFIVATWLDLMDRHFAEEIRDLDRAEILDLRTDRRIARKAAEVYSRENAQLLAGSGVNPTFTHLRLAFLVGGSAAVKILSADPDDPVALLLEPAALRANPFLNRMTVADLVARAERDLRRSGRWRVAVGKGAKTEKLGIKVRCNLGRPSCRKWLFLKKRQLKARAAKAQAARRERPV
jgi:hypothetical protein